MRKARSNLGGSIEKTSNKEKPYRVRVVTGYSENGNAVRKTLGNYKTKREAEAALVKFKTNPYNEDLMNITVAEAYEKWHPTHCQNLAPRTKEVYEQVFKLYLTPIHKMKLREIRVQHVVAVLNDKGESVQRRTKGVLNLLFKWAMKREIVTTNYVSLVDHTDINTIEGKTVERRIFTNEEVQMLWDNLDKEGSKYEFTDLVLVLLYTGMRVGELIEMKTKDVYLDENYMIGGTKRRDRKTGKIIPRIIPIHPAIKHLIENRMASGKPYLFTTKRYKVKLHYDLFWEAYRHCLLGHTAHDTRHTFVSRMRELRVNDVLLKMIVGHSDKNITTHYTHIQPHHLLEEVSNLHYDTPNDKG